MTTLIERSNVNQLLPDVVKLVMANGIPAPSRNGKVIAFISPLVVGTLNPQQRVLFDPVRDANPFFHLFEGLWMLAGRNDVEFVSRFVGKMKDYSDDGEILNGAYGHRWSFHFGHDQLNRAIGQLDENHFDRRVVIQMYDAHHDTCIQSKDIPCNIAILPRIFTDPDDGLPYLDISIINRSNDIIWGMLGANMVHFSMLQEYLAARLSVVVGQMTQFSTNAHVYEATMNKVDLSRTYDYYQIGGVEHRPMVDAPEQFIQDCRYFCNIKSNPFGVYANPFFNEVACPMLWAWEAVKKRDWSSAYNHVLSVKATDWQRAGREWIVRRQMKWTKKQS